MEPSHIPEENLCKADLVRAKLLIQAHWRQLVQYVKQLYNMDLSQSDGCSYEYGYVFWQEILCY